MADLGRLDSADSNGRTSPAARPAPAATDTAVAPDGSEPPALVAGAERDATPVRLRRERSPAAVVRLVLALCGLALVQAWAALLPATHEGLRVDLLRRAGSWAAQVGAFADALALGASLTLLVGAVVETSRRHRFRRLGGAVVAVLLGAAVVIVAARLGGTTRGRLSGEEWRLVVVGAAMAVAAASFTAFRSPFVRWALALISVPTLVGVLGAGVSLAARMMVLLAGFAVGSAVAAVSGTTARVASGEQIAAGLERAGLGVQRLQRLGVDARGSQPWAAELRSGRRVVVKVAAHDELRAAQLFAWWRRLTLKDPRDERSPTSVKRAAEHEAFVAQRARAAGVRTPAVVAVGVVPGGDAPDERSGGEPDVEPDGRREQDDGAFIAFDTIDGEPLAEHDDLGDATLRDAWAQVNALHRAGIAHRDLRAANLLVADGETWVIDFGFAEIAADGGLQRRDVAELLASTAAVVGPARAVEAAVAVLGPATVADALPSMQPMGVSTASRQALPRAAFGELRELVRAAAGVAQPELPQLRRASWKGVLTVLALGIAIWTLLPQVADGVDLDGLTAARPGWVAVALTASALTYVGAAASLTGSVAGTAPFGTTLLAQVASSFTNRITPARVGGMALNLRYLVQQGNDRATAATGVAVSTAAGTVVHVAMTVVVLLWAGGAGVSGVRAPDPSSAGPWVMGAVVLAGLAMAVQPVRRRIRTRAVPSLRRSGRALVEVLVSPRALVLVLGGSLLVTTMNVLALGVSLRAVGGSAPWVAVALVSLAGSALASVAPTPGGLGATEAALVAGLVAVGVGEGMAVPTVLLFRLATFWVPILPGWACLAVLQRRGDL